MMHFLVISITEAFIKILAKGSIKRMVTGQMWVWEHAQTPDGFEAIAQAIKRGEVYIVGDGS